jgi:fructokinase
VRIGIDLGGTKIEGVLLATDGTEHARDRVATPRDSYGGVIDAIAALVDRLEKVAARPERARVGVGTPGFLSPHDGLIRNSNLAPLNGHAIDRDLGARLGRPVRVANDANCFVLSEVADGAARAQPTDGAGGGPDVVFGATLGTGVGGGFVVDGRVQSGANGSAGQWSHTTLPFWRPEDGAGSGCFCRRPACIESFLAGRGLAWDYHRETGATLLADQIAKREQAGEPQAAAVFARYEDRLARALAAIVNFIDPRAIVLGGGVSNNARLFTNVPKLWERYTVADGLVTRLVPAQHGDASGVRGAAWLWSAEAGP